MENKIEIKHSGNVKKALENCIMCKYWGISKEKQTPVCTNTALSMNAISWYRFAEREGKCMYFQSVDTVTGIFRMQNYRMKEGENNG